MQFFIQSISRLIKLNLLAISLLFTSGKAMTQEIKKMKITELDSYIHRSDHPLIVNFWATFCMPCIKEIP